MITLDKAKKALELSEEKAKALGIKVTTTVVDEHGTVIVVSRMDGAFVVSPKFSYLKAYTSATLGLETANMAQYCEPGKPYFGLNEAFASEMITIAGGLPIKSGNKIIGGIGVGGSLNVDEDVACAKEALKAFE